MALYDSVDCLARLRREIGVPSTADFPLDADCYAWLGEAQIEVFSRLAVYAPNAIRQPPRQMVQPVVRTVASCVTTITTTGVTCPAGAFTLADIDAGISGTGIPVGTTITGIATGGASIVLSAPATANGTVTLTVTPDPTYSFTFGVDADGNNLYPVGALQLFNLLTDMYDNPLYEGVDFQMEGNRVRTIDGNPWPYSAPPFYQSLILPLTLSATVPPTLRPVQARCLIVDAASVRYAEDTSTDAAIFEKRYEKHWSQMLPMIQAQYAAPFRAAATHPTALPGRYRFYGSQSGYYRGR